MPTTFLLYLHAVLLASNSVNTTHIGVGGPPGFPKQQDPYNKQQMMKEQYDAMFAQGQPQYQQEMQHRPMNFIQNFNDDQSFPVLGNNNNGANGYASSFQPQQQQMQQQFDPMRKFPPMGNGMPPQDDKMRPAFMQGNGQTQTMGNLQMNRGGPMHQQSSEPPSMFMPNDFNAHFNSLYEQQQMHSAEGFTDVFQVQGLLDTGVDLKRILPPTVYNEDVSSRLIRPQPRTSVILDLSPFGQQQPRSLEQEALQFEEDCLEPVSVELPPSMTNINRQLDLTPAFLKRASDKVLFYIFYNMPLDQKQGESAKELEERGWKYGPKEMRWYKETAAATNTTTTQKQIKQAQQQQNTQRLTFDPQIWEIVSLSSSSGGSSGLGGAGSIGGAF
ncbi:hypothetical protein FGO68_gene7624 [Halteria grandinella]|uniref:NOT2/NOT3/NOT5 C-terminal domain-containing protein n=1 Tax=Halteria grandinella TaxID=5974 RepID=A0A8J8P549_HALGN|nr:hypothetical protein FGO68_gene7624 [Halteria grandinella]